MRYYAIADLHGRYDLFTKAIDTIDSHADVPFKIVCLGDYIDRGPDSNKIIDGLMSIQGTYPDKLIALQGNHEAMMGEVLETPSPSLKSWWEGNGGDTTWASYGGFNSIPIEHYKWIKSLPIYFEAEKQLFVHAGVPQAEMVLPPKKAHHYQDMQWMLYDKRTAGGWRGKHVVHGHHQFEDGPHVWHGPHGGRTDLDCYAWRTGRLVVGVFDDSQGPALEFIEVKDA